MERGASPGQTTRRELVSRCLVAGAAATFVPSLLAAGDALARAETEADVLRGVLEVELLLVYCYGRVLQTGVLSAGAEHVARHQLSQELAHVRVLSPMLVALGGTVPSALDERAAEQTISMHQVAGSLTSLGTERDALRLLMGVEAVAEGAYYLGVSKMTEPALLRFAAEILGNEAQHATALSELLHPGDLNRAVPSAFVQGVP